MQEVLKVAVLGTGRMGSGIIRLLLQKEGMKLVGVYGRRIRRAGLDVAKAVGLDTAIGIQISNDLSGLLQRTQPRIVIQATCSKVVRAADEIRTALRHGAHVISIAEEMAFPAAGAPQIAAELHQLAMANQLTVLGTGINPGFVLDLLVIALTGVCCSVESITARRINDLSPFGPSVLSAQGVGLSPEAFMKGVADGSVVGHIGFPESISMIAKALGWEIDKIDQQRAPIVSNVKRETPFMTIEPGFTAGCMHTAVGYQYDRPVIRLIHPQQVHPHLENVKTGDFIEIKGEPNVNFSGSPEIPGGIGTMALAVNMIPQVINSAPGLKTMADFPVPAAIMGDVRRLIHSKQREKANDRTSDEEHVG